MLSLILYPWPSMNCLVHSTTVIISSTPTSSASVELLVTNFCRVDPPLNLVRHYLGPLLLSTLLDPLLLSTLSFSAWPVSSATTAGVLSALPSLAPSSLPSPSSPVSSARPSCGQYRYRPLLSHSSWRVLDAAVTGIVICSHSSWLALDAAVTGIVIGCA